MPGYHLSSLGPLIHLRLKIASALLGKSIKEFITEAIEEKISRSGIPTNLIPNSVTEEEKD